jgi:hypothetical protein
MHAAILVDDNFENGDSQLITLRRVGVSLDVQRRLGSGGRHLSPDFHRLLWLAGLGACSRLGPCVLLVAVWDYLTPAW